MIKFDMRAILEMMTTLNQTYIEKFGEINPETSRKEQMPEEDILPTFPLKNWQDFLDLENLLETTDIARAELVSLCNNHITIA